jgi:WD40 repeat protein
MARFRPNRSGQIARLPLFLTIFALLALSSTGARAQALYDRPILVVDPDMHGAETHGAAADRAGSILVTGSYDRSVRIWSVADGKLLRTIFMPTGPDNIGQIYTVSVSSDGKVVAAGGFGWENPGGSSLYLFDPTTGRMSKRIALPGWAYGLAFSADGRYLAATGNYKGVIVYRPRQ